MLQHLGFQAIPEAPARARSTPRFVALIQKLRWMGLDAEAEELFTYIHDEWPCEALISTAPDTD